MKSLTVEQMLQVGYGCGLQTIGEAYQNVMSHYDLFFPIEGFAEAKTAFHALCIASGLTEPWEDALGKGNVLKDMTIVDAAALIGYTLKEIDLESWPQDEEEDISDFTGEDVVKDNDHCKAGLTIGDLRAAVAIGVFVPEQAPDIKIEHGLGSSGEMETQLVTQVVADQKKSED